MGIGETWPLLYKTQAFDMQGPSSILLRVLLVLTRAYKSYNAVITSQVLTASPLPILSLPIRVAESAIQMVESLVDSANHGESKSVTL